MNHFSRLWIKFSVENVFGWIKMNLARHTHAYLVLRSYIFDSDWFSSCMSQWCVIPTPFFDGLCCCCGYSFIDLIWFVCLFSLYAALRHSNGSKWYQQQRQNVNWKTAILRPQRQHISLSLPLSMCVDFKFYFGIFFRIQYVVFFMLFCFLCQLLTFYVLNHTFESCQSE